MRRGFTLIEILAVVVIIGVLVAIAIPIVNNILSDVRLKAYRTNLISLLNAGEAYVFADIDAYSYLSVGSTVEISISELQIAGYLETIKDPNGNGLCSGYILVTKLADFDYDISPHIKCGKKSNIVSSQQDGLIAHWKFDGNLLDYSLNNNYGKNEGGAIPTTNRFDEPEMAYKFDGVDDFIDFGSSSVFDVRNELTLSAWIKYEGNFTGGVITKGQQGTWKNNSFVLRSSNTRIRFLISDGENTNNIEFPTSLGDNKWHYIVATLSETKLTLYVDGEKTGEKSRTVGPLKVVTQPLKVGQGYVGTHYKGSIDEIRIYNRALSADEIKELYYYYNVKIKE